MRKIKFRGKSLKNKKWVYGDLMRNICATRIVRYKETDNESGQRADWDYIEVDDSTVGQFTGLTDCNGKEIYEGDIIKVDELAMPCEVIWYDKTASFQFCYHVDGGINIPKDALGLWVQDYQSVITVVDNIHDNPELYNEK